ncbi:MAG: sulfite exporter TauE/SafE family protein [Candidatus Omnitrophica bacterium]|nr:sulfite exporter TauE/SafE family protein [Candidatus Omnitrophota bacterium]MBU1996878.1 sulfite exporter TauE/SafE family protein [Candidatus Omnitrophota bacterium]
MSNEITVLIIAAASIGFFHTIFGPDHYVPFIVLAKAKKWSYMKTIMITIICGIGHVGSSVILGLFGVGLGVAVGKLEIFESVRGNWAAWALIVFGFVYFIYGIKQAIKNKPHTHPHVHIDGNVHDHKHSHAQEHSHVHEKEGASYVPWALFIVFVLGPCEPLIPLLMYPAAKHSIIGMVLVATIFSIVTISTMLATVLIATFGINLMPLKKLERYVHALSGFAILLCGCAIQFLGL